MLAILKFRRPRLSVLSVADEYVLVRRADLERLLLEIRAIKAVIAEEARLYRRGVNKLSAQASQGA